MPLPGVEVERGPRGRNYDVFPYREDLTSFMDGYDDGFRRADGTLIMMLLLQIIDQLQILILVIFARHNGSLIGANGFSNDGVFRSGMIRRASMNSHDWIGGISNLNINSGKMRYSIGIDLRK